MRRSIIVFAAILSLFVAAGCKNKNQVTCTGKVKDGNGTYTMKVTANLKDGKVKDGSYEMIFSTKKKAKEYCSIMSLANSLTTKDKDKVDYKCKGKSLIINSLDQFSGDEKVTGLTKKEFISKLTAGDKSVTCK